MNGISTPSYSEFSNIILKNPNKSMDIVFVRNGKTDTLAIKTDNEGRIGVYFTPITQIYSLTTEHYNFLESIPKGIEIGVTKLKNYISSMKYVFTKEGAQQLGGFGTIGSIFPATWDWESFWSMTAFLSVILAFMNILPIPALDGGHVLFLLYEVITLSLIHI